MRVENTTHINAPPEIVWAVTIDVERWPEWTPTVTAATRLDTGPLGVGSATRLRQPMQPEAEWVVEVFEPGQRFAWGTRRPGLHMVGVHELRAAGDGTECTLAVEATGILALLLWPLLRPAIGRALADENRGLKRRCEEGARPSSSA